MKRVLAGEDALTGAAEADEAADAIASLSVSEGDVVPPPSTTSEESS